MLTTLRIKNLAIVENVRVEFRDGLNVITGETGAGKSILIGALTLVLGGRADKNMIRTGEDKCGVEASFALKEVAPINFLLEDLGIDLCEDGQLIVQRIISESGNGKNLINGCAATVQMLKKLGNLLVDMHGPHDHQSLLNRDFQLEMLDSFAQLVEINQKYKISYRKMLDIEAELKSLDGDDSQVAQQIDLLSYQVNEIEAAGLSVDDEETLAKEHARAANAQRIIELSGVVYNAISEDEFSAFNAMTGAQNALMELSAIIDDAKDWKNEAESISIQLQELASSISNTIQSIDADPERLQWLDDRITLIHALKRKYGATIEEILIFGQNAADRLNELQNREEKIAETVAKLETAKNALTIIGKKLHSRRKNAAKAMADAVTSELRDLGFEHGVFSVNLEPCEPGPTGMDEIEFGFAPNLGETMRPLRAIASSGEISRVMLAIKTILANHDMIPVMVFDEIDANVGGETANAVGKKLAGVASTHQVICITHLPQVAVHGSSHFVVSKQTEGNRTKTIISALSQEERIPEVARMLGGKDLTSVIMRHAEEMLAKKEFSDQ